LKIRNPFWVTDLPSDATSENPDEISLSDDDDDDTQSSDISSNVTAPLPHVEGVPRPGFLLSVCKEEQVSSENPDEIGLADDEESESQSSDIPTARAASSSTHSETRANTDLPFKENDQKTGHDSLGENKINPDSNSDTEPPPKVFKLVRRNQNMYSTTEDSDD
jgi:hypothetical protein